MNPSAEPGMDHVMLADDRSKEPHGPSVDQPPVQPAEAGGSVARRLLRGLMLAALVVVGGVFALYKMRVNIPGVDAPRLYAQLDAEGARAQRIKERVVGQYAAYFHKEKVEVAHPEGHKVVVTSVMAKSVTITQEYVAQIRSRRHIDVCALNDGYLQAIPIKEGQSVKEGDLMFEVVPTLYKARLDAKVAERDYATLELNYSKTLADKQGISQKEVSLFKAKLAKAQAEVDLATAELNFTRVKAPFEGIVDRLKAQQGSLVKEGDMLTTLSDNRVMWVYFNVSERRYLEYMAEVGQSNQSPDIELILADHSKFPDVGKIGAIEAKFNNETGNIPFRADFPNPKSLLRHGQTGTVLIHRPLKDAVVIPQRATFENLAKRYVFILGKDDVVHQREIDVRHELEDVYVIGNGLQVGDRIVLEGIRQVHDGEKIEFEYLKPEEAMVNQKNRAE